MNQEGNKLEVLQNENKVGRCKRMKEKKIVMKRELRLLFR